MYVTRENEVGFYKPLKNTISLRYNLLAALKTSQLIKDIANLKKEYQQFLWHRFQGSTPIIKDPFALFSAAWLAERFGVAVVVVIRHPAAFVSSIKKLHWSHPFSHFLAQSLLMQNVLYPFADEIKEYTESEHNIIDQAILLWRLIHHTILQYQQHHPDWIFIRHEDLSQAPLPGFGNLFSKLNLEFSEHVKEMIDMYSNNTNPREPDTPIDCESTLKRNSQLNIWNWKNRLTAGEIEEIRYRVADISQFFYSDDEW
jgi:hypothetical protein